MHIVTRRKVIKTSGNILSASRKYSIGAAA
jgi:hypothetical protein